MADKDLIDRAEVLKLLPLEYQDVIEAVNALPTVQRDEWLKYPEEKPPIEGWYEVTLLFSDGTRAVRNCLWQNNRFWETSPVVAFHELPEPYQERSGR